MITSTHLRRHYDDMHGTQRKFFSCQLCNYISKRGHRLRRHMSEVHHVASTWYNCSKCLYKCKRPYRLVEHLAAVHDIGDKNCIVCFKRCGVLRSFMNVKICRECAIEYGAKKERIELKYIRALQETMDMPFRHDVRINGNVCSSYRPDALFLDANKKVHIQFELDEHQHRWKSGSYDCDEKRISEIYDEFGDSVPDHYVVIRLNPDGYSGKASDRDAVFKSRFQHLVDVIEFVRTTPPPHRISIIYMYYDEDNDRLARNIPKYLLDDTRKHYIDY